MTNNKKSIETHEEISNHGISDAEKVIDEIFNKAISGAAKAIKEITEKMEQENFFDNLNFDDKIIQQNILEKFYSVHENLIQTREDYKKSIEECSYLKDYCNFLNHSPEEKELLANKVEVYFKTFMSTKVLKKSEEKKDCYKECLNKALILLFLKNINNIEKLKVNKNLQAQKINIFFDLESKNAVNQKRSEEIDNNNQSSKKLSISNSKEKEAYYLDRKDKKFIKKVKISLSYIFNTKKNRKDLENVTSAEYVDKIIDFLFSQHKELFKKNFNYRKNFKNNLYSKIYNNFFEKEYQTDKEILKMMPEKLLLEEFILSSALLEEDKKNIEKEVKNSITFLILKQFFIETKRNIYFQKIYDLACEPIRIFSFANLWSKLHNAISAIFRRFLESLKRFLRQSAPDASSSIIKSEIKREKKRAKFAKNIKEIYLCINQVIKSMEREDIFKKRNNTYNSDIPGVGYKTPKEFYEIESLPLECNFFLEHELLNKKNKKYNKDIRNLTYRNEYLHFFKTKGNGHLKTKIQAFFNPTSNQDISEVEAAFKESLKHAVLNSISQSINLKKIIFKSRETDEIVAKVFSENNVQSPPIEQEYSHTPQVNNVAMNVEKAPVSSIIPSAISSSEPGVYFSPKIVGRGPRQSAPDASSSQALLNRRLLNRSFSQPATQSVASSKPPQRRVKFALPLPRWTTVPDLTASVELKGSSMQIGNR